MRKRGLATAVLCCSLAAGLIACGSNEVIDEVIEVSSESVETESVSEVSDESEAVSESDETEETSETSEVSESENTSEETTIVASTDIADAVYGADTTEENAIPLGTWGEIAKYTSADGLYHTIYVRITNAISMADDEATVQAAVALNNEYAYDWGQIDLSDENYALPSDIQWHLLTYEIYVPEDYPAISDYDGRISEPIVTFSVSKIGRGGIPSADGTATYIGLSTVIDLESYSSDTRFFPGNTYTFNNLYAMVEGFEEYVFDVNFYESGTTSSDGDMLYAYYSWQ